MKRSNIVIKRSLYQCRNARVFNDRIYCSEGHKLGNIRGGKISISRLVRGDALEFNVCQGCKDYEKIGLPVLKGDRGWSSCL